jgi:exosortase A-associated hydrolase 2
MALKLSMASIDIFFLAAAHGWRFCILHTPPQGQATLGGLIYIHPFAEEMNMSRRMVATQAKAFANMGYAVLQIDLYGCGDSSGDFENASWEIWLGDVLMARKWFADRFNVAVWLWGLRAGCLLAGAVAELEFQQPSRLLFWQPVVSGQQHLTHFLRLSLASEVARGVRGEGSAPLVQKIAKGESVEVAGYRLSSGLANSLARAKLDGVGRGSTVACFELSMTPDALVSPGLVAQMARWQSVGCQVTAGVVEGPAFWQNIDSPSCPGLMDASVLAISSWTSELGA